MPLTCQIEKRHRHFFHRGVCMLSLYADWPHFADAPRLLRDSEAWYRSLMQCAEAIAAKAAQAYDADPSPRRRFTHKPHIITCTARVSYEDETLLSLCYRWVWQQGGRVVDTLTDGDTFRKKDAKRLSLWQCSNRKIRKEAHLGLFSPFFLDKNGKVTSTT